MPENTVAYIALGSNLSEPKNNIKKAIELIALVDGLCLRNRSEIITTKPLAGKTGNDYANCVLEIQTDLNCRDLLGQLQSIESKMGRKKSAKWSDRIIDLDILLFGNEIIDTDDLKIPHSQMHLRSFVLSGLCEIAPDIVHPVMEETVSILFKRLGGEDYFIDENSPQLISIAGVIGAGKTTLASGLAGEFNCELLKEAYDTNPFLAEVYAGNQSLALDSQLFFLVNRAEQLSREVLQNGRPIVSDYIIDKERIYASAWLDDCQLQLYNRINPHLCNATTSPAVVVYLRLSPEDCLNRIHYRNRPYEQGIDVDFLKGLHESYEELFANWNRSPLFVVESAGNDFRIPDEVKKLAQRIKHYVAGA